jgi:hypothetical protein
VQHDAGAAARSRGAGGRGHRKIALAVRRPQPCILGAGPAGNDLHAFGDHEGGIKADAEPADQRLSFGALAAWPGFDAIQKGFGAGACDRAERIDQLVAIHTDAVILDGKLPRIERHRNARFGVITEQLRRRDGLVA